jgi:hypothetical protein
VPGPQPPRPHSPPPPPPPLPLPCPADSSYDYYVQLVPTRVTTASGTVLYTMQYSATDFEHSASKQGTSTGGGVQPGVAIKYDFSPIQVNVREKRRTFLQFVTSVCAILGGVFALSGVVNNIFYRSGVLIAAAQQTRKPKRDDA